MQVLLFPRGINLSNINNCKNLLTSIIHKINRNYNGFSHESMNLAHGCSLIARTSPASVYLIVSGLPLPSLVRREMLQLTIPADGSIINI